MNIFTGLIKIKKINHESISSKNSYPLVADFNYLYGSLAMFLGPYWALTDPTFFGTPESTTTILGDWFIPQEILL